MTVRHHTIINYKDIIVKSYNRVFKDDLTESWYLVGKIFVGILAAVICAFYIWGDRLIDSNMQCTFLKYVDLYCPGCGGTRAFQHCIHGEFIRSFIENPFVIYFMIGYVFFMINTFVVKHTRKVGFEKFPVTYVIYAGVAVLLAQCIIRNVLYKCFGITCL